MKTALAACLAALTMALPLRSGAQAMSAASAAPGTIPVVAAENFYGDLVRQIGGAHVSVTSILSNPDQDPHLFEASPATARALSAARLVVYNGADYDPWMDKLLGAIRAPHRTDIVAAKLVGKRAGDNPHLWYAPRTMPAVARAVATYLGNADAAHRADYQQRLAAFTDSLKPIDAKIASLHARFAGTPVTATEPVFGYMAEAIGLDMRNARFQMAVMNDTEPSASQIAAFERDLREHRVKVLIYNSQATDTLVQRLLALAKQSGVPAISVTETQPAGQPYAQWMLSQLNALEAALQSSQPRAHTSP